VQTLVPKQDTKWLRHEVKLPSWMPPNWVFPAVWIPLKVLQSVAAWVIYKEAASQRDLILPLGLFGVHLLLGNMWNIVFFNQKRVSESLTWMGAFWVTIAGTIASFSQISPAAAWMIVPTQIWVTIAAKLNWDIAQLNSRPGKTA